MIRYDLTCSTGHAFDSWFQSSAAFDALAGAARLACPICGSADISKVLMAPSVASARAEQSPLASAANPVEEALAALRRQVEENSDYVGMNFAAEARRMHDGDVPERSIYGEARPDEARQLIEDGVRVAPLPFLPRRKTN